MIGQPRHSHKIANLSGIIGNGSGGKQEISSFRRVQIQDMDISEEALERYPFLALHSARPATAAAARGCNVQRSRRLAFSQAERLLISVHHTFRGRHP